VAVEAGPTRNRVPVAPLPTGEFHGFDGEVLGETAFFASSSSARSTQTVPGWGEGIHDRVFVLASAAAPLNLTEPYDGSALTHSVH
jgi:hypothetical protein